MIFLITAILLAHFSVGNAQAADWSSVTQPTKSGSVARSIGTYTAGCLQGGVSLPANGTGYQVMRLSRNRVYGHPNLIDFIEHMGQIAALKQWGTMLVGDLGQPRGGPTLSGHRSHQTGLDVDIWYLLSDVAGRRSLRPYERESWSAPSVIYKNSNEINPAQWSLANEQMLEAAARAPEVERIFVHAGIKRQLCMRKTPHDWLRKIRPWWGHDDHFHVRLKCPENSPECRGQETTPEGDGCDATLAWWFSEEAQQKLAEIRKQPPGPKPILPVLCEAVLRD
jgi:penicillin-insensitive murein DD-endopeptidase